MKPVGVFDSGFGGVSFLKKAVELMPEENYIYYGDNANAPYGDRPEHEINSLPLKCANYLMSRGIKALVVACNTATGTAIRSIRERVSVPVLSMEPAIKPACSKEGDGKILMLATVATTQLSRYKALKMRMPNPERVIDVPCPGLVNRIEKGMVGINDFDDLLSLYLAPYKGQTIDSIVLGCTHYVFIKEAIDNYARNHFSGRAEIIDGSEGTVRQLERVLDENGVRQRTDRGTIEFCTSGEMVKLKPIFKKLMSMKTG